MFRFSMDFKIFLNTSLADTDDSANHHTDNDHYDASPGLVKAGGQTPDRPASPRTASVVEKKGEDENGIPFINDSPKSDVVMKEDTLPPYLPAIQGCRNVEEFQCLNR